MSSSTLALANRRLSWSRCDSAGRHADAVLRLLRERLRAQTGKGRTRKAWAAVSINKAIDAWSMLLADALGQGLVTRNVAEHARM